MDADEKHECMACGNPKCDGHCEPPCPGCGEPYCECEVCPRCGYRGDDCDCPDDAP